MSTIIRRVDLFDLKGVVEGKYVYLNRHVPIVLRRQSFKLQILPSPYKDRNGYYRSVGQELRLLYFVLFNRRGLIIHGLIAY